MDDLFHDGGMEHDDVKEFIQAMHAQAVSDTWAALAAERAIEAAVEAVNAAEEARERARDDAEEARDRAFILWRRQRDGQGLGDASQPAAAGALQPRVKNSRKRCREHANMQRDAANSGKPPRKQLAVAVPRRSAPSSHLPSAAVLASNRLWALKRRSKIRQDRRLNTPNRVAGSSDEDKAVDAAHDPDINPINDDDDEGYPSDFFDDSDDCDSANDAWVLSTDGMDQSKTTMPHTARTAE